MVYVPVAITATTPRSARLMQLLERQFLVAKPSIDIHLHDDAYYEKSIADTRFFSATHMGTGSNLDADKIDGKHYDELIGALLPVGIGFAWNGAETDVPPNWHIGDGSTVNGIGLPDTRGSFIMGAGAVNAARSKGGQATISNSGGTVTIAGHTLTIAEIPSHYHDWHDVFGAGTSVHGAARSGTPIDTLSSMSETTDYNHTAADEAHNHATKAITFNAFSIVPAYVAKYIIFKVS
jgi:microcystin-dependent protein